MKDENGVLIDIEKPASRIMYPASRQNSLLMIVK